VVGIDHHVLPPVEPHLVKESEAKSHFCDTG
jgi:hypothetical protein